MHGKLMFMGFLTKGINYGLRKLTSTSLTPTSSNLVLSETMKVHFLVLLLIFRILDFIQ